MENFSKTRPAMGQSVLDGLPYRTNGAQHSNGSANGSVGRYTDEHARPLEDLEAEQSTLGAMLMEADAAQLAHQLLNANDFHRELHKKIFAALCALLDNGDPLDVVTASAFLREQGQLDECGRADYLASLIEACPSSANIEAYARIVKDTSARRKAIEGAREIERLARTLPPDQLAKAAANLAQSLARDTSKAEWEMLTLDMIMAGESLPELVEDLIFHGTAVCVAGATGSLKTFALMGMGLCIAAGIPWQGRDVMQGAVIYVAAEGKWTLRDRATAWKQEMGMAPKDFYAIPAPVDPAAPGVAQRFAAFIQQVNPVLVVFDTFSQCNVSGKENANDSMADFVRGMVAISKDTGATTLVVHHPSLTGNVSRGGSALKDNIDQLIVFQATGSKTDPCTKITSSKSRVQHFADFALRGKEVVLPYVTMKGKAITSLVLEPCEVPETKDAEANKPAQNKEVADRRSLLMEEVAAILTQWPEGVKWGHLFPKCLEAGVYGEPARVAHETAKTGGSIPQTKTEDCPELRSAKSKFNRDLGELCENHVLNKVPLSDGKEGYVYGVKSGSVRRTNDHRTEPNEEDGSGSVRAVSLDTAHHRTNEPTRTQQENEPIGEEAERFE